MRKKSLLVCGLLTVSTYAFAQNPEVEVKVKEEKEKKDKVQMPIEKKDVPKTETTIKGDDLLINSGAGGVNIFKSVELTPSVNVQTDDAYGLGGGSIRIRGFDNSQIGVTIDGMPLNDSGNFALYPHEYIDVENLESVTVERGSVNKRSPFYVEIGGAVRLITKPPKNRMGFEYNLRAGSFDFQKEFFRFDTGIIPKLGLKSFISFSHTEADKWKGPGKSPQYRDHLTIGLAQNFGILRWEFYFNNNAQLNYFYRPLNYAQSKDLDNYRWFDYTDNLIFTNNGVAYPSSASSILNNNLNYYKFYKNPYDNREYRANIEMDLTKDLTLSIKPYYWWGRGSGTSTTTFTSGGNTFLSWRQSFNFTDRPGVIAELTYRTNYGNFYGGYWYERAELKQWRPSTPVKVNPDGTFELITATSGTPSMRYDYIQKTVTTTNTPYIFYEKTGLAKILNINLGVRFAQVKRDFKTYTTTSTAPSSSVTGVPYYPDDSVYNDPRLVENVRLSYDKTYRKTLPSFGLGINITENIKPYFSYSKNFRVPQNFIGTIPSGVNANFVADQLKPEESDSYDLGVRFDYGRYYITPSVYYVDYKNRIIATADPDNPSLVYFRNAGKVKAYGWELEAGLNPTDNIGIYTSLSYNRAFFKDKLFYDGTTPYNIDGKELPDKPKYMYKLGLNIKSYGFQIRPTYQYIGPRYGNIINTEKTEAYNLVNLYVSKDIYKRNLTLYLDIYNLTDTKFIGRISPGTASGSYFVGAPFTISVGIRGRF
jgi:iron complex outermembrane receptor protein